MTQTHINANDLYSRYWSQYLTMRDIERGRKAAGDLQGAVEARKQAEIWKRAMEMIREAQGEPQP